MQTGDWPDFSTVLAFPYPSPWNARYIGPNQTFPDGSALTFISRGSFRYDQ